MSYKADDDSWVTTKTERYFYAADKLTQAVKELKREPMAADYRLVLHDLIPAVREQLLVFRRLSLELKTKKFPWDLAGFVKDPRAVVQAAHQALGAGESWSMMGQPEDTTVATFKVVSDVFFTVFDCNNTMRKDLGWPMTRFGDGPSPPPPPPRDPVIYPAG